jgi:hypothetical protein
VARALGLLYLTGAGVGRDLKRVPLVLTQHRTVYDVRRAKAAFSSGCKSHRQSLHNCIDLLKGVPVRLKD